MKSLYIKYKGYIILALVVIISSLILWIPFTRMLSFAGLPFNGTDTGTIYRNYDGPLYVIPAKTWYNPEEIERVYPENTDGSAYFAAHLPGYPASIALLAPLLGYRKAMIAATVIATILLAWVFYFMLVRLKLSKHPLTLTVVMLFLPRFLVLRGVGTPEPLFMVSILGSLLFFEQKKFIWAGVLGGIAAATKTPAVLLFLAYLLTILDEYRTHKQIRWGWLYLLLIPASLGLVGVLYLVQYGDFWAYFHTNFVVPMPYPFAMFNYQAQWVQTGWIEEIVLYLVFYATSIVYLRNLPHKSFSYFALVFFVGLMFVQHRDISRYAMPLWPLALIAFERFFTDRRFVTAGLLMLPAIYMYAWNFMQVNVMPIPNWAPFM